MYLFVTALNIILFISKLFTIFKYHTTFKELQNELKTMNYKSVIDNIFDNSMMWYILVDFCVYSYDWILISEYLMF